MVQNEIGPSLAWTDELSLKENLKIGNSNYVHVQI